MACWVYSSCQVEGAVYKLHPLVRTSSTSPAKCVYTTSFGNYSLALAMIAPPPEPLNRLAPAIQALRARAQVDAVAAMRAGASALYAATALLYSTSADSSSSKDPIPPRTKRMAPFLSFSPTASRSKSIPLLSSQPHAALLALNDASISRHRSLSHDRTAASPMNSVTTSYHQRSGTPPPNAHRPTRIPAPFPPFTPRRGTAKPLSSQHRGLVATVSLSMMRLCFRAAARCYVTVVEDSSLQARSALAQRPYLGQFLVCWSMMARSDPFMPQEESKAWNDDSADAGSSYQGVEGEEKKEEKSSALSQEWRHHAARETSQAAEADPTPMSELRDMIRMCEEMLERVLVFVADQGSSAAASSAGNLPDHGPLSLGEVQSISEYRLIMVRLLKNALSTPAKKSHGLTKQLKAQCWTVRRSAILVQSFPAKASLGSTGPAPQPVDAKYITAQAWQHSLPTLAQAVHGLSWAALLVFSYTNGLHAVAASAAASAIAACRSVPEVRSSTMKPSKKNRKRLNAIHKDPLFPYLTKRSRKGCVAAAHGVEALAYLTSASLWSLATARGGEEAAMLKSTAAYLDRALGPVYLQAVKPLCAASLLSTFSTAFQTLHAAAARDLMAQWSQLAAADTTKSLDASYLSDIGLQLPGPPQVQTVPTKQGSTRTVFTFSFNEATSANLSTSLESLRLKCLVANKAFSSGHEPSTDGSQLEAPLSHQLLLVQLFGASPPSSALRVKSQPPLSFAATGTAQHLANAMAAVSLLKREEQIVSHTLLDLFHTAVTQQYMEGLFLVLLPLLSTGAFSKASKV